MLISTWDELSMEWANHDIEVLETATPEEINKAIGKSIGEWQVTHSSRIDNVMTIITRSDMNHLCIIVVNYEEEFPSLL